jgi:hypothetical protein
MNEPLKTVKDGINIVTDLIKAAGENPQVKQTGENLGHATLTISKTINNALLPLAAINFAFDKARKYFNEKFQPDLVEKTKLIPEEHITEPKASVAGPALQGLAFAHEEPNLKEMYLNLLATAMDRRIASSAHPAFVEIIKQLEGEEAGLLRFILRSSVNLSIAQIRKTATGEKGWIEVATHLMNLCSSESLQPVENPDHPAMVDNWIRLGLVEVTYDKHFLDEKAYEWVDRRPEYKRLKAEHENDRTKITIKPGIIARTALGLKFAAAAGLLQEHAVSNQCEPPVGG